MIEVQTGIAVESGKADTLPKLLLEKVKDSGKRIAMKRKDFGIWSCYSWEDYYKKVKYFCLGLVSHGMEFGDKVAMLGDNAPELYWAQLAAQAAGGVVVGLYSDSLPEEVKYILQHSDSKFILAEDQEQVDKILEIKQDIPLIRKVIYWDPRGLTLYEDRSLMSFDKIIECGQKYEETHPGLFEQLVEKGKYTDVAVIFYTSGTTGLPKGAVHTHRSLLSNSRQWFKFDPCYVSFRYLSMLPPAWLGEEYFGVMAQLVSGMCVAFPEEPHTLQENFREIAPQVALYGPRQLEGIVSEVELNIRDAGSFKRFMYYLFLPVGYKVADMRLDKQKLGIIWRVMSSIAELLVFKPIKDRFGLTRIKWLYVGGTVVNPQLKRFFLAIGVNLKTIYGISEGGLCADHTDGDIQIHSSGVPRPGCEIRISDDGEILVRNDSMFQCYYKNPEATMERLLGDWLHTEDAGYLDEKGHLVIIDRMKEMIEFYGGAKFSPQFIEVNLRHSPYVKDAVAFGGKERTYISTLINIDYNNVGKWAEDHNLAYTTFTDLSQKAEVYDLIQKDVEKVNQILPSRFRIRKYCLLHKELDADEAELTRTRKLRRGLVEDKYRFIVDALYSDADEVIAEAEVKYRDGRRSKVLSPIRIRTLDVEDGND